jgi:hypothetical protein
MAVVSLLAHSSCPSRVAPSSLSSKPTLLSLLLSMLVQLATPSNSFSLPSLALILSTFAAHPCIFSCLNFSGSKLFASFRGTGILRLCQLLSLWMMLALMNWCITSVVKLHPPSLHLILSPVASSSSFLPGIYGLPRNATVLRSHRNHIIKPCGTRKARMCSDGSKRAAPERCFAQTYALCIDQPCMRLFFALSATMGFVVMGVDCTNAYANSPSPAQAAYVRIDDAYTNWYRSRLARKLTARWYYQYSRPWRDTWKPVYCGKSTATRFSTI